MLQVACPVQNLIENLQVLHAHGILLHGHLHYKWMVAVSEILRTKARLKYKTKKICVNLNRTLRMLFHWATRKRIPPSEAALHHHPPPMVLLLPRSVTLQHFLFLLKISDLIEWGTFPYSLKSRVGAVFAQVAIRTLCAPNAITNFVWSRREIAFSHFMPNKYNEQSS